MKKIFALLIMSFMICTVTASMTYPPVIVEAHSGRTDSRGGHRDNRNRSGLGSYHYHHGYPAHLHTGGVCPYLSGSASPTNRSTADSIQQSNDTKLRAKYKAYTDDYNNKLQSGYFKQDINMQVSQFIKAPENSAYLQSLLTPEEATDLLGNSSVQTDILSKIVYMRVYEVLAQQQLAMQQNNQPLQDENANTTNSTEQDNFIYNLVTQVQTQLQLLGYYMGEVDGIFDAKTQQALINFQIAYNLTPDGTINEQVVSILNIQM